MEQPEKHQTLLLIDDDDVLLRLCKRVIERSGKFNKIITLNYAADALEYLENDIEEKIDFIFLDIKMPRMSGFEFLEKANEKFGDKFLEKTVFMMTSSTNPDDIEMSRNIPSVKGYVIKPLNDLMLDQVWEFIQRGELVKEDLVVIRPD